MGSVLNGVQFSARYVSTEEKTTRLYDCFSKPELETRQELLNRALDKVTEGEEGMAKREEKTVAPF